MLKLQMEKQLPAFCGPCALKYVMDYYGVTKSQKEIANLACASKKNGSEPWDLLHAAFVCGFSGEYIIGCSMDRLKELLFKEIPVIVDYRRKWGGHYSVVVGFREGEIFLADPSVAEVISMKEEDFEKAWFEEYTMAGEDVKVLREAVIVEKNG